MGSSVVTQDSCLISQWQEEDVMWSDREAELKETKLSLPLSLPT